MPDTVSSDRSGPRRPESISDDASSKATPRGEEGSEATPRSGAPARQKSAKWAKASTKVPRLPELKVASKAIFQNALEASSLSFLHIELLEFWSQRLTPP